LEKLNGMKNTNAPSRNLREQPQSSYQPQQTYGAPAKSQPERVNPAPQKSEPKTPSPKTASIKNYSPPPEEVDFNSIVQKWEGFVDAVKSDKGLILGPFMQNIKLLKLEGNNLVIAVDDSHGKEIIDHQQEYIASKTHEYFGRKMKFTVKTGGMRPLPVNDEVHDKPASHTPKPKRDDSKDPYINAIVNELGGEEIG